MSKSLFGNFMECEGATIAFLNNQYSPPVTPALDIGNYIHTFFESHEAHKDFVENHKWEIYKSKKATKADKAAGIAKDGKTLTDEMYADYVKADNSIDALQKQKKFSEQYVGETEYPVIGWLSGMWWKGKLDLLNIDKGYFIDLKTTADLHKRIYSEKYGGWTNWVFAYGYVLQMAVYKRLLEQKFNKTFKPIIWAVTKEDNPDVVEIDFQQDYFDFEYYWIDQKLPRIRKLMNGEIRPTYCGKCDFCKSHKQILSAIDASDL